MKKIVFIAAVLLGIIATSSAIIFNYLDEQETVKTVAKKLFIQRKSEVETLINEKEKFLKSFAKYLSSSKPVIEGYLENNRTKIINFVYPLYKELYPEFIEEIHYFKSPAIDFVNFANLKHFGGDVSKVRSDILWVNSSFKPSVHFYVCRMYPGLRATYPVIYKGKMLGSVSFGTNITFIAEILKNMNAKEVTIYLNDKILKNFLSPKAYKKYMKYPLYEHFRVLGKIKKIDLNKPYTIKNSVLYSVIKLNDLFGNTFGYLIILDNLKNCHILFDKQTKHLIYVGIFATILGIFIMIIIFNHFNKAFIENNKIIDLIKNKKFEKLPQKTEIKDIVDEYKNKLIDLGKEIELYINILTQKIEKYYTKAYTDGLTKTFNRTFLQEKAQELYFKYKLAQINVGFIMIDIDDFKKINDTYGHDVGDLVLIQLANNIKKNIRKDDLLIRYGGEEFVIILPYSDIQTTYQIAEKIRKSIEISYLKISDKEIKFTISLGISEFRYDKDNDLFNAVKRADINLYKAKRNGKNRVEI